MKKWLRLSICFAIIFALTGCGKSTSSGRAGNTPADVNDVLESGIAAEESEGVDLDLTALSSTIVYSEVYNMMVTPEKYIGKTVKMSGAFSSYYDEHHRRCNCMLFPGYRVYSDGSLRIS